MRRNAIGFNKDFTAGVHANLRKSVFLKLRFVRKNNDVREICENQIQSSYCDGRVTRDIFTGAQLGRKYLKVLAPSQETDR